MFKLTDKVALVWGGGQGMGERSALRLAKAGSNIAVVDLESTARNASQARPASSSAARSR